MRKAPSGLLLLLTGFLVTGVALSQIAPLRPLPLATTGLSRTLRATRTDQADLQRAGYTVRDTGGDISNGQRRERSYTLDRPSGSSAILIDTEHPAYVLSRRELLFTVTFSVRDGRSPTDMPAIAPRLIAAAEEAMTHDPAVVAGLGYLATVAGPDAEPQALQIAVIDYLDRYSQPSTPLLEACSGCGLRSGFGDDYQGGPATHAALNVQGTSWRIAGLRRYFNGESVFTLKVSATLPRM